MSLTTIQTALWKAVPSLAIARYKAAAEICTEAQQRLWTLPLDAVRCVGYLPDEPTFIVDADNFEKVADCLGGLASVTRYEPRCRDFIPVLVHPGLGGSDALYKRASAFNAISGKTASLGQLLLMRDSPVSKYLPFAPSPVASTIAGGLLGAAGGYGAGWLAKHVLPEDWDREKVPRNWAMIGAGLGALPGVAGIAAHLNTGQSIFAPGPFNEPDAPVPPVPHPWAVKLRQAAKTVHQKGLQFDERLGGDWQPYHDAVANVKARIGAYKDVGEAIGTGWQNTLAEKRSYSDDGYDVDKYTPIIPVNQFNQTVWNDPRVANRLSTGDQAAMTGLVTGAAQQNGTLSPFVTPFDVARIAIGMGSGYVSGKVVGDALGWMFAAPDSVQEKLKNTGMWAGVVKSLVPLAFGR